MAFGTCHFWSFVVFDKDDGTQSPRSGGAFRKGGESPKELLTELVKLAAALAQLAIALRRNHTEIADDDHAEEEEGR
jgi:hypothetical protein